VDLAALPIEDAIGAGTAEETQLTLDRMVLNLATGQRVAVTGERADLPGAVVSEVVTLAGVEHFGGFTTLSFTSPGLAYTYVRTTVALNANVALATHGETVSEVLGSGDGAQANQRFTLRKPPLTYTASSGETGAQSSLEIRVNGLRWDEAPSLYGLDATSQRYAVRIADDARASVNFGDGEQGARLPSGNENVTAVYRSGIGRPGMVGSGTLTLLMTRPLGIRGVSNPLPASGAADPEGRDQARDNAPLGVLAMGRLVSLQDAEDFARAFAGIGKTRARAVWRNGTLWVHLTVAAAAAIPPPPGVTTQLPDYRVDPKSPLGQNLVQAIETFKEPSMLVRVDTYQPLYFSVTARLGIDPRYRWEDVEGAARAALAADFAFAPRAFGQPVTTSEVVSLIQGVAGVVFVDLEELRRFDVTTPLLPPGGSLLASGVKWGETEAEPGTLAQLLLINPLGITLTRVSLVSAP
jgi:predicted phage baseplate assembly protein